MTGHLLALEHATRGLALADGTRRAVRQRVAVRGVLGAEVVTLDHASEALALGGARTSTFWPASNTSTVSSPTGVRSSQAAQVAVEAEFPQPATGFDARLGEVAGQPACSRSARLLPSNVFT